MTWLIVVALLDQFIKFGCVFVLEGQVADQHGV
jgi:hypothetical protein